MPTPRSELVDPDLALHYHVGSRCVRRARLCGVDPLTGKDYSHRKQWLIERLHQLTPSFAIAIDGYAIMSNHFHIVLYYDPHACLSWTDEEVAWRWVEAFPPREHGQIVDELKPLYREQLLAAPDLLAQRRRDLGSLSYFMQHLKHMIAYRANREDGVTGHFFEQRFYSGVLLDETALLTSMAYVDLNPVRAKLARSIEACADTAIQARLQALAVRPEALEAALGPVVSGLAEPHGCTTMTLAGYLAHLRVIVDRETGLAVAPHGPIRGGAEQWHARVASHRKRQRAYGTLASLTAWFEKRNLRALESPLPG